MIWLLDRREFSYATKFSSDTLPYDVVDSLLVDIGLVEKTKGHTEGIKGIGTGHEEERTCEEVHDEMQELAFKWMQIRVDGMRKIEIGFDGVKVPVRNLLDGGALEPGIFLNPIVESAFVGQSFDVLEEIDTDNSHP